MLSLESQYPTISLEFHSRKFCVFESNQPFLDMVIDYAHKQGNTVIKSECGAIGVTEDPLALRRWIVAEFILKLKIK